MEDIHDCLYHSLLSSLIQEIHEKLDENYDWQFFDLWLGDDSNFGGRYRECFVECFTLMTNTELTQQQIDIVEGKGRNLEETIHKWLRKWKTNHPSLPNEKMPISCLKIKVSEYIVYQLRQRDMQEIVGNPC